MFPLFRLPSRSPSRRRFSPSLPSKKLKGCILETLDCKADFLFEVESEKFARNYQKLNGFSTFFLNECLKKV